MVSRQVTIVGSGMRRIDDRGRHLRRDVGRLSRIDDAKTFKAAKKKLGIMSRRGRFGRDGEWSWTLLTKVAPVCCGASGQDHCHPDGPGGASHAASLPVGNTAANRTQ